MYNMYCYLLNNLFVIVKYYLECNTPYLCMVKRV